MCASVEAVYLSWDQLRIYIFLISALRKIRDHLKILTQTFFIDARNVAQGSLLHPVHS